MKKKITTINKAQQPVFIRACAIVLIFTTSFSPSLSSAAGLFPGLIGRTVTPPLPLPGTLPELLKLYGGASVSSSGSLMTVLQNEGKDKVVIDWSKFNIGSGAMVRFYQGKGTPGSADWKPNSNYAALNRIYDLNPSVINGNLIADGKVYMINRNGVFFGPSGKVQVQSLVASAFNISNSDFESGRLIFKDDHYDTNPNQPANVPDSVTISNEGSINTNSGGSVFFVGPKVQNIGTINAPGGKIDLVGLRADGQVEIKEILETRNSPIDVIYSDTSKAGDVANMQGGKLVGDDGGWIGLYGNTVRNDGLIRAVTTRRQNGVIYLSARDLVATGEGSNTDVEVSDAPEAMGRNSLVFSPGSVAFGGLFSNAANALARVDHEGSITAHSGDVRMEASDRVFLGEKSNIDVSGLSIDRPMSDQFIEAQLNSLYLRDDYGQKNGGLLPGSNVTIDVLKGSAVGNMSSYYLGMLKNARDLSTVGGSITIGAPEIRVPGSTSQNYALGDLIISKGAGIDLSGGKVTYGDGADTSTKLIGTDGRVYDISNAPQWMTYSGIYGSFTKSYGKFGSEKLDGVSFGGQLIPLKSKRVDDRVVGGQAGSLTLRSRVIEGLADGLNLKASVTTGLNQTINTPHLESDKSAAVDSPEYQRYLDYLISQNRGLEAPAGGRLVIGNALSDTLGSQVTFQEDAAVSSVVVKKSTQPVDQVRSWNDQQLLDKDTPTEISADMIRNAGLSSFAIYANTSIKTEKDANIELRPGGSTWVSTGKNDKSGKEILRPGGSYSATARRIEFLGSVTAPGGSVDMLIRPNITSYDTAQNNPLYRQVAETIFLGSDSRISTAGERVDNSLPGMSPLDMHKGAFTNGGNITLRQVSPTGASNYVLSQNNENSIVIKDGAELDVSGGYLINEKGTVSGGNAGTLTVKAPTISLGGDLRGFSLPGKDGGEIVLHAKDVLVAAQGKQFENEFDINSKIPAELLGQLVLGADRFQSSGFSRISLSATDNLTVAEAVHLSPSILKSTVSGRRNSAGATCSAGACFSATNPTFLEQIGKTYLTLNAGKNVYDSSANVDSNGNRPEDNQQAMLKISQGAIVSAAPGGSIALTAPLMDIAGTVDTPGGTVTARASKGNLTIRDTGRILAGGYNKTGIATKAGEPAPLPVPVAGGTVSLEATLGTLDLQAGALVDVSGSERIVGDTRGANGLLTSLEIAGDAGSLSLAYGNLMQLDGTIAGAGKMAGTRNGSLTVKNTTGDLTINESDVNRYQGSGFDALTFVSPTRISIPANLNLSVGRSLTLDSQLIQGSGSGGTAVISAPWIKLSNTGLFAAAAPETSIDTSSGKISLLGGYLDVQGSILLKGFSEVNLQAKHDLTFADRTYTGSGNNTVWDGALGTTAANLILQAGRIYPATASNFTITTPGKATILPGVKDSSPIYSAGGNLTIAAARGIDHNGFLAAPQGNITLDGGASGRVDLSGDSIITTAGFAPVAYGIYDSSKWWDKYVDSTNKGTEVTAAPSKSITLKGKEVVVRDGAVQDLSGGGSVYANYWQPGISGTYNPLTIKGRYVILPDGSATRPGDSVYLQGIPSLGLKAGVYSILPIEYAFVPGALVIQDTGMQLLAGQQTISKEKYPVVGGYMTVRDTSVSSQLFKGFSVRRAVDVLKEGDFSGKSFTSGNAGNLTLNALGGAYFGGILKINPLDSYKTGIASFSARNVDVVNSVARPDFSQPLSDTLQLAGNWLSNLPVSELRLGDKDITADVTVQNGVSLKAKSITLSAGNNLTLKDGAQVEAIGSDASDYASIATPGGSFTMERNSTLKAISGIKLDLKSARLDGEVDAGKGGYFSLAANRIVFGDSQPATPDGTNVFLTDVVLGSFSKYSNLMLTSRSDMEFRQDLNLRTGGTLTLDAARYLGAKTVSFSSKDMTLLNSGSTQLLSQSKVDGSSLSFNADNITVAPRLNGTSGNISFDQFGTVNINSANDLVLKGEGAITTGGNLNLFAARVTTGGDSYKADSSYTAANITLDGRNGAVTLNGSLKHGVAGITSTPGGSLQILGDTITQTGGVLDVAAGQIGLTATGDITIKSAIKAMGSEQTASSGEKLYYSGGKITLQSDGGKVDLQSGSSLDVSAAAQGDAGSIVLSATSAGKGVSVKSDANDQNGNLINGAQLSGRAGSGGKGGSFDIDSANLDGVAGLDGLSGTLKAGGFNELISIRSRAGDLTLTNGNTLTGREVVIAADGGAIAVGGIINADTSDGSGRIELYSGKKLIIEDKAILSAKGTDSGANGGTVILSSQDGADNSKTFNGDYALNVNSGSTIDVSAVNGGNGGAVALRAYQGKKHTGDTTLNDVNTAAVSGTIKGASKVAVEAARTYANTSNAGDLTLQKNDAGNFMADAATAATKNRLFGKNANDPVNHLQAGIEISSAVNTDLTIDQVVDLKNVRPGGEAVVLTLKSGKNLLVNQSLTDAPTAIDTLHSSTMQDSAALNLVAGSDGGANYMAVKKGSALTGLAGTGDLTIANGKWVYTENGPIRFAAGNDANFKGTSTGPNTMINPDMKYNLGSYGGSVRGNVGRDLNLTSVGSAIQTALGNIDIRTGRDLNLGSSANAGAIRTTGEYDNSKLVAKQPGMAEDTIANRKSYWTYHDGGSIGLNVGNSVNGILNASNGWDGAYIDSSRYSYINDNNGTTSSTQSVNFPWYLTAGFGGSREQGQTANIPVTVGIATMGGGNVSVRSGGTLQTQIGAFGNGDVTVASGGDINGRFRVMNGSANLSSGGSFGTSDNQVVTEMADARVRVAAMGDLRLGSVQNPDNSRDRIFYGNLSQMFWNMTYSANSSFSATSLSGNATLYGSNRYAAYSMPSGVYSFRKFILPATFNLSAAGDINVLNKFVLAPSKNGNLGLFAGGSIRGILDNNGNLQAGFKMQDVDISSMYGRQADKNGNVHYSLLSGLIHNGINHLADNNPVVIKAGKDITALDLYLSKPAEVTATAGNITTLNFIGQNTAPGSLTIIKAGGNIDQGITVNGSKPAMEIGGPGTLLVQAGGNILLGNSGGINSVGNSYNSSFNGDGTETDSDLIVSAGAYSSASMAKQDVKVFFDAIRVASDQVSQLKADGKTDEADRLMAETEKSVRKYFYKYDKDDAKNALVGNLDMVDSAISSRAGSIYAMAGSNMNVGKSAISNAPLKTSGITTLYGGELSIYAGGNIEVNESRLMTYLGGDITIWSDQGDINAGRGSKTLVSAPTPVYNYDPSNPDVLTSISFTPPSAGSGIRALTFDADGSGPLAAPDAGNIHIYAKGALDAGEAGIQGNKLFLVATTFPNSQNIVAGAGSVGVPSSNQNTISIGPMTGATDMTNDKKMIETISGGGAEAGKKTVLAEAEDFLMKYLDVKVIDLTEGSL